VRDESELLATLERSTRTGVHVLGLRVATYALAFFGSVLTARALGPEGRGRYVLPLAILTIMFTLGNLGLEQAQVYLAGQRTPLTSLWANATVVGVLSAVVAWLVAAGVLLLPAAQRLTADIPMSWIVVTAVQLPVLLHILYWLNILQLAGRVRQAVATGCVAAGAQTIAVGALFVSHGLTPFRVLVLIGAGNLVIWLTLLIIGVRAGIVSFRVDRPTLRRGLRFGVRAQLGIVFVFLLLRVDQLMVQRILGFRELGVYSLAVVLAELLWLLSDPFATALLPHQVNAAGDDDLRLGFATARLTFLLVGVAAAVAWFTCPIVIRLVYGPDFDGAVWPFRWLLPGIAALAIQRPLGNVLLKRGRPGLVSLFGAGALVLNIGWNLMFLPALGIVAASIGSSLAYLFLAGAYVVATRRMRMTPSSELLPRWTDVTLLGRALRSAIARPA
jgi:O-antigen/teichoic acid export membrane protein